MQKFHYTPAVIASVHKSLSAPRLARYLVLAGGDMEQALEFHLWNTELGETLHLPIQLFELLYRNALNDQLTLHHGQDWYDSLYAQLGKGFQGRIDAAKDELRKQHRVPIQPPDLIALFTFGNWVILLDRRYDRLLWKFCLFNAFPNRPKGFSRQLAKSALVKIKGLRNRIVHHEPIYHRPLDQELAFIINVASWICPDTADWIDHHCNRFRRVWNNRPSSTSSTVTYFSARFDLIDWCFELLVGDEPYQVWRTEIQRWEG